MYPTCPIRKETSGETEKIIGNWINNNKDKRKDIILATKVVGNGFKYIRNGGPITRETIKVALHESLKRLKTDYIDLYQLHWPNRGSYHFRSYWNYKPEKQDSKNTTDEFLDIINTLNDFKKEGLIRAIGVSNETCWGVMKLNEIIKEIENLCIASIQNEYSLMCRLFDNDFNELSNDYFKTLLDMSVKWSPNGTGNSFVATDRISGKQMRDASKIDLVLHHPIPLIDEDSHWQTLD